MSEFSSAVFHVFTCCLFCVMRFFFFFAVAVIFSRIRPGFRAGESNELTWGDQNGETLRKGEISVSLSILFFDCSDDIGPIKDGRLPIGV